MLRQIGVDALEVRLPRDLDQIGGLIIPGGESTTIGKLLIAYGMMDELRARARAGFPVYGTCAGAIVLAKDVDGRGVDQPLIGVLDVSIMRNAFGRQVDSFEADLNVPVLGPPPFHAIFIRAPVIESVGPGAEALASLDDGTVVAVRQGNLLATAFHPELTRDGRFHGYFVELIERCQ